MNKKEKQLLFIHAGSGITFTKNRPVDCEMFFNGMYLLENVLYYSDGRVATENVVNVVEHLLFIQVITDKIQILYNLKGVEVARSQFDIDVLSDLWYAISDTDGKKKIFDVDDELVSDDVEDFKFFEKKWYAIKSTSFQPNATWKLFNADQLVACSNNEFLVDVEHSRYTTTDNQGKYSIFAESTRPLYKRIDNYAEINNLLITKVGDVFEIFVIDENNVKDKSIWKGNQEELLNNVYIFDYIEDWDVVLSKLLKH